MVLIKVTLVESDTVPTISVGESTLEQFRDDGDAVLVGTQSFWEGFVARTSVFAPRRPSELARVLRPSGVVVVVSPGDDHLAELREPGTREALGVLDVAENKRAAVAEAFSASRILA